MSHHQLQKVPIELKGQVVDGQGNPVADAQVVFANSTENYSKKSDRQGNFVFSALPRSNGWLTITKDDWHDEVLAVYLHQPHSVEEVSIAPVQLNADLDRQTRFLFAGDTSFGRRFVNPEATGRIDDPDRYSVPEDRPDALIQTSDPLSGALEMVSLVKPVFEAVDYPIINLESPIIDNPENPHPHKKIAFYSLPETLEAVASLGIDYVSLGNNHAFDYLEPGIIATLEHLNQVGINASGIGLTPSAAYRGFRTEINESPYSFLSFSSVTGSRNNPPLPLYVATDNQGGAADLTNSEAVKNAIAREAEAGYIPIAQLHTGREYFTSPDEATQDNFELAVDAGAKLVVGHHPHVAQGFDVIDGVPVIHSLGNFIFDQSRLETQLSMMVQVDMADDRVTQIEGIPIYIQDFQPRLITGDLANRFIRNIAEKSSAIVYPYNSRAKVSLTDDDYQVRKRELTIPVEIPESGKTVINLKQYLDSHESLAFAEIDGDEITGQQGRDLLMFGGMEETDLDGDDGGGEVSRWEMASEAFRSNDRPHQGAVALYSRGSEADIADRVFFSVTASTPILLADEQTTVKNNEVAILNYSTAQFAALNNQNSFSGFLSSLETQNNQSIDLDALYVHDDGKISFSSNNSFIAEELGEVQDGSIVTYDSESESLELLLTEETLFPDSTTQDIDAFHLDEEGTIYFSTVNDAVLDNLAGDALEIRDGDVVQYDLENNSASILLAEKDLFFGNEDINGISFSSQGEVVFSTTNNAQVLGRDRSLELLDGAIASYNLETENPRLYKLQEDLFASDFQAQADINAIHLEMPLADELPPSSTEQISFRNRIRVEGDATNTPNKDLTVLGYIHQDNSGPVTLTAQYYASKGSQRFGTEIIYADAGGTTDETWMSFSHDLSLPNPTSVDDPLTDDARSLQLFLHHRAPVEGEGLVGIDDLNVISWQPDIFDLSKGQSFSTPHGLDFLKINGNPGEYTLTATAEHILPDFIRTFA